MSPPQSRDPSDPNLATLPTSAIAFVLGVCVGRPQRPESAGRIAGLVEELKRRGVTFDPSTGDIIASEYDDIVASLDPALAATLALLVIADRGQRWAQRYKRTRERGRRASG